MTEEVDAGGVMSFREHLFELRSRLVRVAIALVLGFLIAWNFRVEIFGLLSRPISEALADNGIYHFQAIHVTESVIVYLKTALIAAIVCLSPLIFWQLWAFVAPGLYRHERRFIVPLTAFSVVFFVIGATFSYSVLLPFVTDWLIQLTLEGGNAEMLVTLENAYGFAFTFLLMFGLVFELPLVIFFLALWGRATGPGLLRFWRYFVVLSFLISAALTPPEPVSQILMAVPLNALYGFGILVAYSVTRARAREPDHAGAAALRMMGLSLAGAIAVGLAAILVVHSLPDRSLVGLVPQRAAWVVGGNPAVIFDDPPTRAVLETTPGLEDVLVTLAEHGVAIGEVGDAVAFGDEHGHLAATLRADGAGDRALAIRAAFGEADREIKRATDLVATYADTDTLIVGHRAMVIAALATARGERPGHPRDVANERLLQRLRASGPAWAWLPQPSARGARWLGGEIARDVDAAGAVMALGRRSRFSVHVRARAEGRIALLDASLQRAREEALALEGASRSGALARAVADLADEVARRAPPDARRRLDAIRAELARLDSRGPARAGALSALAPHARGWSMSQNDLWFELTTELDDHAIHTIIGAFAAP